MSTAERTRLPLRRKIVYALILAAGLGLGGFAVLEWYLRANTGNFLGPAAETRGMWRSAGPGRIETVPGWRGEHTVEDVVHTVRLNQLGMRGPDVGAKVACERRVLVLGDSFVWGYGVAEDETFAAELERLLRVRLGDEVRVGNGGAPSYGTVDQIACVERYRQSFAPDVVVSCIYTGNDFEDDCLLYRSVVDGYMLTGAMAQFVESSWRARLALHFRTFMALERQLAGTAWGLPMPADRMTPAEQELARVLPPPGQRGGGLFMDRRETTPAIDEVIARCRRSLERIRDLARPARLLAVIIPTAWHAVPGQYQPQLTAMGFDPAQFDKGLVGRRLAAAATTASIACLDLTPLLIDAEDAAADWQPRGRHFTAQGHRRVAARLLPEVLKLLE